MRRSTVGWQICFQWRDCLKSCQALNYLKELHIVETAEYAVAQGIYHE